MTCSAGVSGGWSRGMVELGQGETLMTSGCTHLDWFVYTVEPHPTSDTWSGMNGSLGGIGLPTPSIRIAHLYAAPIGIASLLSRSSD